MGPSYFVGSPDWRSALLAAVFALPWLVFLGRGWLRRGWLWAAVAAAAILFPFSIAWVQVPLQQAVGALWARVLSAPPGVPLLYLVALPGLLVASLVQEAAKLAVAAATLRALGNTRRPRAGLALGAAAGAGYGAFEAFWTFNRIFAAGWSWATVELAGPVALFGFLERLFAVPFHAASAALSGYGLATRRPWRFFLLAVGLHTALNYSVVLLQTRVLSAVGAEVWGALVAALTIGAAIGLCTRAGRAAPPDAARLNGVERGGTQ